MWGSGESGLYKNNYNKVLSLSYLYKLKYYWNTYLRTKNHFFFRPFFASLFSTYNKNAKRTEKRGYLPDVKFGIPCQKFLDILLQ